MDRKNMREAVKRGAKSTGTPKESKGRQTRQRIVEAAAPIFNQFGYEGSSISALMEATGLQKGGIYRHFESKEQLASEVFDYTWDAVRKARLFHIDEQSGGVKKLKQFIANFVERRSPVPGGCPVLNTAIEADDGNPVLRAKVVKALRTWTSQLESYVEQGKAEKDIRSDVDAKSVATLLICSLEGALMLSKIQRTDEPMRLVQSHLNEYLENNVLSR